MAQRKVVSQRQSELQPVYDFLDMLHPARLRAHWNRIGRRAQWTLVISLASLVLIWVVLNLLLLTMRHVRATTGPFLFEALQAPYELSARPVPLPGDETVTVLPAAAGDYTLQAETVQIVAPGMPAPVQAAATEQETAPAPAVANFFVGQCLLNAAQPETETPCTGVAPLYLTFGTYGSGGTLLDAAAARFDSAANAREAMKSLRQFSGANEAVGNYAVGVGEVDFFYSSTGERYTFTWAHDTWVYTVSGAAFHELEKLVRAFPY
jgi:hypothetical protein